ncbi:hypothetical protein LENED_005363 [Lentinula edodes]|uniref:Uncharacterized protein n=1 Tax=Lentinula edodes TaxID=5353 RepID=A0A1Q3E974_LENED|nr:hypothetical protein LENED_005363 [Lentinula edodes]
MRLIQSVYVMTLLIGLVSITSAIPILNPQSGRHLPNIEFRVSPRRVAQQPSLLQDSSPGDSYFPSATSGRHPNNDRPNIQTPTNQSTLIRSRFQLIFHPVPGGDLDDPSTFENTKRMVDIITRYLNQGVHYHQLSPSDFTLVNGWVADGNGSSPVVEFRIEDSNRRGHCNPFCLGMIDVPYDAGDESENPDTTRIHGTLAQDRWQLHLDHAVSRTLSYVSNFQCSCNFFLFGDFSPSTLLVKGNIHTSPSDPVF